MIYFLECNMIHERKIELLCLNYVLSDKLLCDTLSNKTTKAMFVKRSELINEFVKQYELPNLITDPLKD